MDRSAIGLVGDETAGRAEQRIARREGQFTEHLGIDGAGRRDMDRRKPKRKMGNRRIPINQRFYRGFEIGPRAVLDLAAAKIDFDLGH